MRTCAVLLLVALAALADSHTGRRRAKRELLVRSKRRWVLSTIELTEEDKGPYPKMISQMFNDKTDDDGANHKYIIGGMGVTEEPMGVFSIDESNGTVYAHKPIDRETYSLFHIKFDILDKKTGKKIDRELAFDVEIKDINDNPPKFFEEVITKNVPENTPEGYLPVQLQATDPDQKNTSNSKVTMSVVSQSPAEPKIGLKQLDDRMARLTFSGCFNYDKQKTYKVIVKAQDEGNPIMSSSATINLIIEDANSHPPMFKEKQYQGEVQESSTKNDILRVAVVDADSPNTPGWRATYFFIKGNEDNNYKIETDPKTNEGVLSVIKGKDFERTTLTNVVIGVRNEEDLYVCKDNSPAKGNFTDSVNITIKVIDVNDAPQFEKDKVDVYRKEEEPPGKQLFVPNVKDVDSDVTKIRYVLLKDPAGWVSVDKKTGIVTTTKKMDRESPFVDGSNVYEVVVGAIDDGEPPATGTCTVQIHLGDINDNVPKLSNVSRVMCVDKDNKIRLSASDADLHPFSGPFAFSLGNKDKSQAERWKIDPSFGEEAALVSLKPLPHGNYSVHLMIQDQQNVVGHDTLEMTMCECGDGNICRGNNPLSVKAGPFLLGVIFASLFLFLLLLLSCCNKRSTKFMEIDGGIQSLVNYNSEGGGADCMAEPPLLLTPTKAVDTTDHKTRLETSQVPLEMTNKMNTCSSAFITMDQNMGSLGTQRRSDTIKSRRGYTVNSTWSSSRMNTHQSQGASVKYQGSSSLRIYNIVGDHLKKKLPGIDVDLGEYLPRVYMVEGELTSSRSSESLDNIFAKHQENQEDVLELGHLGPKFNKLEEICQEAMLKGQEKH